MEREGFRHGFRPAEWEAAKAEARAIMYEVASKRRTISYSELVSQIASIELEPHDIRLDHFLGQIASEDDDGGLGLTTVVVVHKTGDGLPGSGFFEMAESQGRTVGDRVEFWSNELNEVHNHWATLRRA
jgi:hypothetical protein